VRLKTENNFFIISELRCHPEPACPVGRELKDLQKIILIKKPPPSHKCEIGGFSVVPALVGRGRLGTNSIPLTGEPDAPLPRLRRGVVVGDQVDQVGLFTGRVRFSGQTLKPCGFNQHGLVVGLVEAGLPLGVLDTGDRPSGGTAEEQSGSQKNEDQKQESTHGKLLPRVVEKEQSNAS